MVLVISEDLNGYVIFDPVAKIDCSHFIANKIKNEEDNKD